MNRKKPTNNSSSSKGNSRGKPKPAGQKPSQQQDSQGQKSNNNGATRSKNSNRNKNRKRKSKASKTTGDSGPKVATEDYSKFTDPAPKTYKVEFFDSFIEAKSDLTKLKTLCTDCDQLNIVIRAEGNMEDPEIISVDPKIKLFAGEAWALIHDRRVEDKWYDAPR